VMTLGLPRRRCPPVIARTQPSTSVHPKQAPEPTNVILARTSSAAPEVSTRKPERIARGFRKLRDTDGGQKPDTVVRIRNASVQQTQSGERWPAARGFHMTRSERRESVPRAGRAWVSLCRRDGRL
jgi:hypothetical protein